MTSGVYLKTAEHRKNLSKSLMGRRFSPEHIEKLRVSHMGKTFKHTEETKEKIRLSNLGQVKSEETKRKLKITRARQIMKPMSEERRRQLSESRKGDKWHTWKGGLTKVHLAIRNSLEYKLWRESVFKRDNWTCVFCKKVGGRLNADHIKPFAVFPEQRFELSNGRTLCVPCHKKTDTYGRTKKNK